MIGADPSRELGVSVHDMQVSLALVEVELRMLGMDTLPVTETEKAQAARPIQSTQGHNHALAETAMPIEDDIQPIPGRHPYDKSETGGKGERHPVRVQNSREAPENEYRGA